MCTSMVAMNSSKSFHSRPSRSGGAAGARVRLVNYGPELRCPQIRHRKIEHRSPADWVQALSLLILGQLLTPGVEDEEQVWDLAEMAAIRRLELCATESQRAQREAKQGETRDPYSALKSLSRMEAGAGASR
jgi:hypothetical protein